MKGFHIIFIFLTILPGFFNSTLAQIQTDVVLDSLTMSGKDSLERRKTTFNGYPYAFYTPESGFAVGAGGIVIYYTNKTDSTLLPSKVGFGGYYSFTKQYKLSVNPALYFRQSKLFIRTPASFGFFLDRFYGIGDDTPVRDSVQYTKRVISASFIIQSPPLGFMADRSGLVIDYDKTEIVDKMGNELLLSDSVTGSNGGEILGFGLDLTWENRDNIFFPNTGGYQYFKFIVYPPGPSDFFFGVLELDVRHYWSFKPDHVFAINFYLESAMGETPFYKLPALGGPKRMRGYFMGRYRDNFYSMFQAEYRQYFWKRLGFVAFGGLGNVASEMLEFNFNNMKYSYGFGLRFLFNKKQKVNLRADIGFGNDGNRGIYFGIEEAF
jgi:outer membrane protein assembly factor BamA